MKINDTHITDMLYSEVMSRRRDGAKIFLVVPGEAGLDVLRSMTACCNCDGSGKVGIQIVVGGPYDEPRQRGLIWHEGHWYNAKTVLDSCPCCDGSGRAKF